MAEKKIPSLWEVVLQEEMDLFLKYKSVVLRKFTWLII